MHSGKIKWFNGDLGYGFIARDGQHDLYVHAVAIRGQRVQNEKGKMVPDVMEGDSVSFEIEDASRGPRAKAVEVTGRVPRLVKNLESVS